MFFFLLFNYHGRRCHRIQNSDKLSIWIGYNMILVKITQIYLIIMGSNPRRTFESKYQNIDFSKRMNWQQVVYLAYVL